MTAVGVDISAQLETIFKELLEFIDDYSAEPKEVYIEDVVGRVTSLCIYMKNVQSNRLI